MLVPCETVTKSFLPAVRLAVTKILVKNYGMTQTKAAEVLGITQAGVNKYLVGNYSAEIRKMEKTKTIQNLSQELAKMIAMKNSGKDQLSNHICNTCENFHGAECVMRHLSRQLLDEFSKKKR